MRRAWSELQGLCELVITIFQGLLDTIRVQHSCNFALHVQGTVARRDMIGCFFNDLNFSLLFATSVAVLYQRIQTRAEGESCISVTTRARML